MAGPEQPAAPRDGHQRGFSFHSNKSSHKSKDSKGKMNLTETAKDKAAHRMHTHADPTVAISEMQPSAMALEKSNMQSLRSVHHIDRFGNPIVDPDRSNPTRHRFERPLETIRSFEAAIDGTHSNRRGSYVRDDTTNGGFSRPTSYYGADRSYGRSYNESNGHYNGRGNQSRPDSYVDSYGGQYGNGNHQQYYGNNNNNYSNNRGGRHAPRSYNDQYYYGAEAQGYGSPHQSNAYDHMASSSGTGSGDVMANSTDPSSVNSSWDRLQQQQQQYQHQQQYNSRQQPQQQQQQPPPPPQHQQMPLGDQHTGQSFGFSGFGPTPDHSRSQFPSYNNNNNNNHGQPPSNHRAMNNHNAQPEAPPKVPPKDGGVGAKRRPSALRKAEAATQKSEKRKSWFKRFSKS